ncbi:MAG: hypothetical protein LBF28_01225 [Rickettsiales bacterium]|nr:hypothetical protein [Rickettsiales bacterium]
MNLEDLKHIEANECKAFCDVASHRMPMAGTKKRIDEILNKPILVADFRITDSKRRAGTKCLQVQCVIDGEICVFFTGSFVLIEQIQAVAENLPLRASLVKIDKYYSFS